MHIAAFCAGLFVLVATLWEAFETIVLPRTVSQGIRVSKFLYRTSWKVWRRVAESMPTDARRESVLGYFGPISLPLLLGFWAISLVLAFGLMQWGASPLIDAPEHAPGIATFLYMSGTTLFTVGYGDVTPRSGIGRALSVLEGGVGIGFLAVIIGYLPVLYQAFSRREVTISLLDARAGSPPSATEMLRRYKEHDDVAAITQLLRDMEQWSAEVLESHLSYPVLAFYRSQHDRESWLSALTTVLDTCALLEVGIAGIPSAQARLTFAMARHAMIDISLIFRIEPIVDGPDRLDDATLARVRETLANAGIPLREGEDADRDLRAIRSRYEPFVLALSRLFLFPLPPWIADPNAMDNWQTSAWHSIDRAHLS